MTTAIFKDIFGNYDRVEGKTPTELNTEPVETTPYERLVKTFTPDEFGEFSNEMNTIMEVSCMSMFFGALYGGVISSKSAYLDFFQNNQATVFKDHLDAKKKLQDKVTLAFGKGAFKWSWRLTLFSTSYVGFTTAVSVYRGKNGILEHVVAGGLAGAMYKFNAGPRGMLVGAGLGNVLGLIAGSVTVGLLKLTGMTMEDVRQNSERWHQVRLGKVKEGMRDKYAEKEVEEIRDYTKKAHDNTLDNVSKLPDNQK